MFSKRTGTRRGGGGGCVDPFAHHSGIDVGLLDIHGLSVALVLETYIIAVIL